MHETQNMAAVSEIFKPKLKIDCVVQEFQTKQSSPLVAFTAAITVDCV